MEKKIVKHNFGMKNNNNNNDNNNDDNNNKYIHYDLQYFCCNKIYQKTYHKTSQIKAFSLVTLH